MNERACWGAADSTKKRCTQEGYLTEYLFSKGGAQLKGFSAIVEFGKNASTGFCLENGQNVNPISKYRPVARNLGGP